VNRPERNAKNRIDRLIQLLGRAECPGGVTFVVSMPGTQKRATQALKNLGASAIHILTPSVGGWGKTALAAWSKEVGIAAENIHLKWPDANHPWARAGGWTVTGQAIGVLHDKGVQLNQLPLDARFSDQHLNGDERWSHAKLYLLKIPRKKKRQLLVTSANWSPAAWGAGNEAPSNFELGVLFETDWKMLEDFNGGLSAPFCTTRPNTGDAKLQWAEATWDGKRIELLARSSDASTPVSATVSFGAAAEKRVFLTSGEAAISWTDPEKTPLTAQFAQDIETLEVNVVDLRPPTEFSKTSLPEVDPSLAAALREAFLLQRYGGPAVDFESISGQGSVHLPKKEFAPAADYSVQAWLEARAAFNVVDQWREALGKAKADPVLLERVSLDGHELRALYKRREGPAAGAEEFGWRLEEEA
jgi:rhodanese-related sulfurtransferase